MKPIKALRPSLVVACFILLMNSCIIKDQVSRNAQINEEMVVTPFGLMPKNKVFLIEDGYRTKIENNHLYKVESLTGKVVQDLGDVTPIQKLALQERTDGNDPYQSSGNDIVYVHNTAPPSGDDTYSSFTGSWVVPAAPAQNTETLFLGQRMVIYASPAVELDAVLQYGPSAAGGGQYWSAGCWQLNGSTATHSSLVTNLTPGTQLQGQIAWTSNSYDAYMGSSHSPYFGPLTYSDIYLFLAGYSKTTGSYPVQFSANATNINVVNYVNGSYGYPTIQWTGATSSSMGEHMKVVSSTSPTGEVDICFYGTPSGLWYNNTVYPVTLTWNGTYGALSYEISYYVIDHQGHYTYYSDTSTTTSYTFPFTSATCRGCDLFSKVRANYAGGVVSDWSATFNTILP